MSRLKEALSMKAVLPAVLFTVIALVAGSVYIKTIGSFTGPDLTQAHYRAALAVATGQLFAEPVESGYGKVQYITGSERYFKSGEGCDKGALVADIITDPLADDLADICIQAEDRKASDTDVTVPARIQYPFLGYVPQAIGLKVGMATGMEPVNAQKLARFLNLLTYITLIVASIILIPRGKWFVAFLGILPTSLYLASSLSSDSLNIAWNMLFVAYVLKLYVQRDVLRWWQYVTVFLLGVGLFMLKVAYTPILLLLLALKKQVISTSYKWLLFAATALVGAGFYLLWSSNWSSLAALVDTSSQLQMIIGGVVQAFLGVLLGILYLPVYVFNLPVMYMAIVFVLALFIWRQVDVALLPRPKNVRQAVSLYWLQVLGVTAAVGSLGLTLAALLLTWTDVATYGWIDIQGFQGRYILPLLPLLLLLYFLPQTQKHKL